MLEIAVAAGILSRIEAVCGDLGGKVRFREIELKTPDALAIGIGDADALIVTLQPLSADHLRAVGRRLRVIGRAGVGLDTIDLDCARELGIAVVNEPDYATAEVATHAVSMLLAVHRRLVAADAVARGDWSTWATIGAITPIEEQTIGIFGGGRIGRAVIDRLRPFAREILLYDPHLTTTPPGVELVKDRYDLLSRSDITSLHLPLTDETRHIIDAEALKAMPEGSILVNVSRGGLIDEDALVEAVRTHHLAGAALDVMDHEPVPANSSLLVEPRILLSPHIGWYSESASTRLWRMTVDGLLQYLSGEPITSGNLAVRGGR